MLSTDLDIRDELIENQKTDKLLKLFEIRLPDKQLAEESNSIYIASVDAEDHNSGLDFLQFRDMVEILIITKNLDYEDAVEVIRTVARRIIHVLRNSKKFNNRLVFRNLTLEYSPGSMELKRGHMLIQKVCDPEPDELTEAEYKKVCKIIMEDDVYGKQ